MIQRKTLHFQRYESPNSFTTRITLIDQASSETSFCRPKFLYKGCSRKKTPIFVFLRFAARKKKHPLFWVFFSRTVEKMKISENPSFREKNTQKVWVVTSTHQCPLCPSGFHLLNRLILKPYLKKPTLTVEEPSFFIIYA